MDEPVQNVFSPMTNGFLHHQNATITRSPISTYVVVQYNPDWEILLLQLLPCYQNICNTLCDHTSKPLSVLRCHSRFCIRKSKTNYCLVGLQDALHIGQLIRSSGTGGSSVASVISIMMKSCQKAKICKSRRF